MRELRRRVARTPLWLRLVAGTLVLVTLAVTLTGGFAVQLLRGYLVDRVDRQLVLAAVIRREPPLPPPADGARRQYGLYYVALLGRDGAVERTLQESPGTDPPTLPALTPDQVRNTAPRPFTVVSGSGTSWRAIAVEDGDGAHVRVVAIRMADIDATVTRLAVIVATVGGVVLVLLGFACHWLVRRSLRPLGEIERTAGAIARGDLSRRVPLRHRRTEVGRLGRAINGMLAQIEAAFRDREASESAARESAAAARESAIAARESAAEARRSEERMRRFIADASHELRTPLTSIRGFAELYRHETPDLAEAARLLSRIEAEAARMGLLVDDLLLLARLDQHRPLERDPVDMLSLVAGAVLDARTLAPDREIDLLRLDDADDPVTVIGDEPRLHQIIANLIANALRHTPPGTPFHVAIGNLGPLVVVEVADQGPGLRPGDADRVFERFYRADPARTRTGNGGTGLGLPIAAALTHAHDGTITVTSAPGHGTTFRVELPAAGGAS
ncbi:two-component sensor histidine kinase [Sphaerisporangium siamense]|uniref:histidine kinase n=1 Tax=Sphaerisporangium siamense TaxID=795645 RepID=A0A7W7G8M6_9ACTN|nr:HAMP domain-containing sensor histidine kinase [Sphaerisporangium siamense]MBB4700492.1 two-component system OmpR family sensor kinase [Sphaerisporangium siamense]GII88345.1 two-component sensor histidine kinase [Sphaerisporangium siamense]